MQFAWGFNVLKIMQKYSMGSTLVLTLKNVKEGPQSRFLPDKWTACHSSSLITIGTNFLSFDSDNGNGE